MGNIIDYLKQYGDKSFAERPLCRADLLLFAQLSYFKFDGLVPVLAKKSDGVSLRWIDERMDPKLVFADKWYAAHNRELWGLLMVSRRYERLLCNFYRARMEEENELQFGAITFLPETGEPVVAFRGTDDSLVGWKEDFNMAFLKPLPAQRMSAVYVNQVACRFEGPFFICGHSKGGNLAVYAAASAEEGVQKRIREVYSFDGPGFLPGTLPEEGYERIDSRVRRILPEGSLVGMLLESGRESYEVVKSTGQGIWQHDPYTWQIGDGELVCAPDVEERQKKVNQVLNRWILTLSEEKRELFVNTIYELIGETGVSTLPELVESWPKNLRLCLRALGRKDAETRRQFGQILRALAEAYGSTQQREQREEGHEGENRLSH
ncbi:MAG: DUF2974 domain-containing protein [Eubacteriales bacterium]|nr:DUF2974 domain-containing protein [Eubacteriales bacterium]